MKGEVRNPLLQWLIYGHVWVAIAVAAQILWTTLFLHEGTLARRYALAALLGSFTAYGVMRLARIEGPEGKEYANLLWYRSNRVLMNVLVGLCGVAAFLLLWPLWPMIWRMMVPAVVLTFFYVTPFTSSKGIGIGLRMVPFLKAVLIAVLWAIVTVAIPLKLDLQPIPEITVIGLTCMRVPLILALAILFDVRDQASDDPALRTMPIVFGTRGAKGIALFLLLCSAAFEFIFLRNLGYVTASWVILVGYAFGVVLAVRARPVRDAFYYAILVDGVMIVIPLCAWVGVMLG
jgi:4-hydroxybenzoate polyprenyltransferase